MWLTTDLQPQQTVLLCLALRRLLGWTVFSKESLQLCTDLLPGGLRARHQVFHTRPLQMLRIGMARSMTEGEVLTQGFSRFLGNECSPLLARTRDLQKQLGMPPVSLRQ